MPDLSPSERFHRAAWTNLAHCQARPRTCREYPLQLACSGSKGGAFPLGELVTTLWPSAVVSVAPMQSSYARRYELIAEPPSVPRPKGAPEPLFVAFDDSSGPRAGTWRGRKPDEWLPEVIQDIRSRIAPRIACGRRQPLRTGPDAAQQGDDPPAAPSAA